ncbi:MAG: hypothetical protein M3232_06525, partial [Thermoproteota archaeon]|nr:hypothetical protein [Thermoproteota archaeon]
SNSVLVQPAVVKYGISCLAIHLAGFILGFIGEGLVLQGVIRIESGIAVLVPFADLLYGLGLVIVVAIAARADVLLKYLLIAGAVIGIGLFYKSAVHEIHIASGLGLGLPHPFHIGIGSILITISVTALVALTLLYNKSRKKDDKIK